MHISAISVHQLALSIGVVCTVWCLRPFLLLGLGASGLLPWRLWLIGHKPPSQTLRAGSTRRSSGKVGGARGWVAGRAGFWGVLATWVRGRQLQPPGPLAPNLHVQLRH